MNKAQFTNMVANRILTEDLSLDALETIVKTNPAFHSAHLLKAQILQRQDQTKLQNSITKIAIHLRDRVRLHEIAEGNSFLELLTFENAMEGQLGTEDSLENTSITEIEISKSSESVSESNSEEHTEDVAEEGRLEDAVKVKPGEVAPNRERVKEEEHSSSLGEDATIDANNEELSFIDWLKKKKKGEEALLEEREEENEILFDATAANEAAIMQETAATSGDQLDLFIANQIVLKKNRKKKPARKTKKKQGLISETLAEVYLSQQKYQEAIDTYEALTLKFPQKSSYFARQIEIVKKNL